MLDAWIVFFVALVPWAALLLVRTERFLHILQLEEYYTAQYWRWLAGHAGQYLSPRMAGPLAVAALIAALLVVVAPSGSETFSSLDIAGVLLWSLTMARLAWLRLRETYKPKKPLVMTARARRIFVTSLALAIVLTALAVGLGLLIGERAAIAAGVVVATAVALFAGHVVLAANLLLWPLEERSRRRFQAMAERKLRERAPEIIAITGSAGKTPTKELVAHLLSARYRVLRTPSSFNTPMGISRTVN